MQVIRKIINSNKIKDIIDVPADFKNKMVEVIVMPIKSDDKKSLSGKLSKYKDDSKRTLEQSAWAMSVKDEEENY